MDSGNASAGRPAIVEDYHSLEHLQGEGLFDLSRTTFDEEGNSNDRRQNGVDGDTSSFDKEQFGEGTSRVFKPRSFFLR